MVKLHSRRVCYCSLRDEPHEIDRGTISRHRKKCEERGLNFLAHWTNTTADGTRQIEHQNSVLQDLPGGIPIIGTARPHPWRDNQMSYSSPTSSMNTRQPAVAMGLSFPSSTYAPAGNFTPNTIFTKAQYGGVHSYHHAGGSKKTGSLASANYLPTASHNQPWGRSTFVQPTQTTTAAPQLPTFPLADTSTANDWEQFLDWDGELQLDDELDKQIDKFLQKHSDGDFSATPLQVNTKDQGAQGSTSIPQQISQLIPKQDPQQISQPVPSAWPVDSGTVAVQSVGQYPQFQQPGPPPQWVPPSPPPPRNHQYATTAVQHPMHNVQLPISSPQLRVTDNPITIPFLFLPKSGPTCCNEDRYISSQPRVRAGTLTSSPLPQAVPVNIRGRRERATSVSTAIGLPTMKDEVTGVTLYWINGVWQKITSTENGTGASGE